MTTYNDKEESVRDFFNDFAETYEQTWDLEQNSLHVGLFQKSDETLEDAYRNSTNYLLQLLDDVDDSSNLLDVCCGSGHTLKYVLGHTGARGTGIDLSDEMIKQAEQRQISDARFIRESASNLGSKVNSGTYTHAISQDGIFLVHNKRECFRGIYKALCPGGLLVVSDFLSEKRKEDLDKESQAQVYETVRWKEGIPFDEYKDLLQETGFSVLHAERRPEDMKKTYQKLLPRIERSSDKQHKYLADRYSSLIQSIDNGAISWGWFVARRNP